MTSTGNIYIAVIGDRLKIGWSTDPQKRMPSLACQEGKPIACAIFFPAIVPCSLELAFHRKMGQKGEWYQKKKLGFSAARDLVAAWLTFHGHDAESLPIHHSKPVGRPRLGQPISITVTDDQRAFLDSMLKPGLSLSAVIRDAIECYRKQEEETL